MREGTVRGPTFSLAAADRVTDLTQDIRRLDPYDFRSEAGYEDWLEELRGQLREVYEELERFRTEIGSIWEHSDSDTLVVGPIDFKDTFYSAYRGVYALRLDLSNNTEIATIRLSPTTSGGSSAEAVALDPVDAIAGALSRLVYMKWPGDAAVESALG